MVGKGKLDRKEKQNTRNMSHLCIEESNGGSIIRATLR